MINCKPTAIGGTNAANSMNKDKRLARITNRTSGGSAGDKISEKSPQFIAKMYLENLAREVYLIIFHAIKGNYQSSLVIMES